MSLDGFLVAPPTLKGATAQKVASKLISAGFVKEVKAKASDPIWRRGEGASYAFKLTAAGAEAIAVDDAEPEDDAGGEESAPLANRDQAAILSKLDAKDARPAEAMEPGSAGPSAPRGGSKLAQVIELLQHDHGATIEELIAATGWLAHTSRAALTGLRKRGYAVSINRSDDNRGSFYRIPAGETGLVEGPAKCRDGAQEGAGPVGAASPSSGLMAIGSRTGHSTSSRSMPHSFAISFGVPSSTTLFEGLSKARPEPSEICGSSTVFPFCPSWRTQWRQSCRAPYLTAPNRLKDCGSSFCEHATERNSGRRGGEQGTPNVSLPDRVCTA